MVAWVRLIYEKHLSDFNITISINIVSFTKTSLNHIFNLENLTDIRIRKSKTVKNKFMLGGFSPSKIATVTT